MNRVKRITNDIYDHAWVDARDELSTENDVPIDSDWFDTDGYDEMKVRTSDIYQKKLTHLSDQDLYDILWCHEQGKFMRADYTIDNILSEMARRQLLGDKRKRE